MNTPNKRELQQIAFNHSSDIDYRGFMNLYKKYTAKPYSFLVIDTTLASDNLLCFRKNLLEKISKLIMTTDDKIRDKKLQYDINREAAKILALSSYLHCHQRRVIEQANFTYSPWSKALEKQRKAPEDQGEKQTKTTEDQGEKQIKALDNRVEKIF